MEEWGELMNYIKVNHGFLTLMASKKLLNHVDYGKKSINGGLRFKIEEENWWFGKLAIIHYHIMKTCILLLVWQPIK